MLFTWLFGILFSSSVINQPLYISSSTPHTSDSLTVYVFLHDECVISQFYTPLLTELFEKYNNNKSSGILPSKNRAIWRRTTGSGWFISGVTSSKPQIGGDDNNLDKAPTSELGAANFVNFLSWYSLFPMIKAILWLIIPPLAIRYRLSKSTGFILWRSRASPFPRHAWDRQETFPWESTLFQTSGRQTGF